MDSFIVKVKIFDKVKLVRIEKNNFNLKNFVSAALKTFDISPDKDASILFWDRDNAAIESEMLTDVVLQYLNCSYFYVKLGILSDSSESALSEELKHFLYENKCGPLFMEYSKTQGLDPDSIQFLSEKLLQFINDRYSIENRGDIENVCFAASTLFPSLRKVNTTIFNVKTT